MLLLLDFSLFCVKSLYNTFYQATGFNGNVASWNVSSVTTMRSAFFETKFNRDVGGWDVSAVGILSGAFEGSAFNQNVSGWDVSAVHTFSDSFMDAANLSDCFKGLIHRAWKSNNQWPGGTYAAGWDTLQGCPPPS